MEMQVANDDYNKGNSNSIDDNEGLWLLITSSMGITLGYVRIDDHDHELSLHDIRQMISGKLKDNPEYFQGWQFGTGWPLTVLNIINEIDIMAKHVLPSVFILSQQSAITITNNTNPTSAATALTYGMSPTHFPSVYPSPVNIPEMQPIFTPIGIYPNSSLSLFPTQQSLDMSAMNSSNNQQHMVTMNSNQQQMSSDIEQHTKAENVDELSRSQLQQKNREIEHLAEINVGSHKNTSAVNTFLSPPKSVSNFSPLELPPMSPPVMSQSDTNEQNRIQRARLQNLLPYYHNRSGSGSKSDSDAERTKTKKKRRNQTCTLPPPLVPIDSCNGELIETYSMTNGTTDNRTHDMHITSNDNQPPIKRRKRKPYKKKTFLDEDLFIPDKESQKNLYCPRCAKKFAKVRGYRQHMTKAHGVKLSTGRNKERIYKCNTVGCRLSFYQTSDLRRHQRVHLKVKPFKCKFKYCTKEFTQRGSIYRHIKQVHGSTLDPKKWTLLKTQETLPLHSRASSKKSNMNSHNYDIQRNYANIEKDASYGTLLEKFNLPPALSANMMAEVPSLQPIPSVISATEK